MWIIPSGKRYMLVLCGLWFISNAEVSYFNFGVSKYFCQKFLISVKIWLKKNKSYWRLYTHIFKQIFHYVENFEEKECTGEGGEGEPPPLHLQSI